MTGGEALQLGRRQLSSSGSPTPFLDTTVILAHLLGISRSELLAHPEIPLGSREQAFRKAVSMRGTGLPVAYITGTKEFRGLPFHVTPDVLIPKPDTEILVEAALAAAERTAPPDGGPLTAADICTGSGCVAVSFVREYPGTHMYASDISPDALAVAEHNASVLLGENHTVTFARGDLLDPFTAPERRACDMILSNPPYVPSAEARHLLTDGRNEPLLALDGGPDGLDLIRRLIPQAHGALRPGGILLIETGEYNAERTADCASRAGFAGITVHNDLEGCPRVMEAVKP